MQKHLLSYLLVLSAMPLFAQKVDTTALFAAFDKVVLAAQYKPTDPGFAVMVIKEGRIIYQRQRGMANTAQNIPIKPNTLFSTGSVTKQFTAACVYLLEEQGKLSTQDSIQKYLPELPWLGHTVKVSHLISHTSGIPDHMEIAGMQNKFKNDILHPAYALKDLQQNPVLSFAPGTDFVYCNTGYMLLSMIVERVSGMSIHNFTSQQIFEPLGMKNTNYHQYRKDALPDHTESYAFDAKKQQFKAEKPLASAIGAVGVQTTLHDFFLWDQNFYNNKLGKADPSFISKMQTTDTLLDGSKVYYGGGLFLSPYRRWEQTVSHTGGWNGFLMDYRRFPNSEISIVVASNNDHTSPFRIADTLSDIILKFKPYKFSHQPLADKTADQFVGVFLSANNFVHHVVNRNGNLFVVPPYSKDAKGLELFFIAKREDGKYSFWDEKGEKLFFEVDEKGDVKGLYWEGGHFFKVQNRYYQKLAAAPTTAQAAEKYAGKYRSETRKQRLKVKYSKKHRALVVKPVFFLSYPLEPLGGNVYRVKGEQIVLRFEPQHLILGNDWVYGLRFKKGN